jgi:hypothetical protein
MRSCCRRAPLWRAPMRLACVGRPRPRHLRIGRWTARAGSGSEEPRGRCRQNIQRPRRPRTGRRFRALRRSQASGLRGWRQLELRQANPDAQIIPMAATGHDTIYAWRCAGQRELAAKVVVAVDRDGYDAGNWKEVDQ